MVDYVTPEEMKALEKNSEYLGISAGQLMECAGYAVAEVVANRAPKAKSCVVFAGPGRNGGDGMVAARHLAARGYRGSVILVGGEEKITDPQVKMNWSALKAMSASVKLHVASNSSTLPRAEGEVLLDALLGTGAKGPLRPPLLTAVDQMNRARALKVAVDLPTGLDPSSGAVLGKAFKADLTVTFHKPKTGLPKAPEFTGELVTASIGIPLEAERFAGPGDVELVKKPRPPHAKKGDFGRVLVVGGNETYVGAPTLTGLAAARSGADLVYVGAPERTAQAIAALSPNLITVKLPGDHLVGEGLSHLKPYLERATSVAVGPGLGLHPETVEAVEMLLGEVERSGRPLVLDADGLKIFAQLKERRIKTPLVLTPHAGEFQILTGKKSPQDIEERGMAVVEAARSLGAVILLKGNVDIISDGERFKLNYTGNPAMTVGGTGDTLTGLVAGLIAQGVEPFRAAVAGAFINGAAGDLVCGRGRHSLLASDLLEEIPRIMADPMLHKEFRRL